MSSAYCLRCRSVALEVLPLSDARITFYRCPQCGREFAQRPGKALTERWGGALSVVLYGTIFSQRPQDHAEHIAAMIRKDSTPEQIAWIVNEIREELAHPTHPVCDILDQTQLEEDLREFLGKVADILEG